jgi:hypothetical protein
VKDTLKATEREACTYWPNDGYCHLSRFATGSRWASVVGPAHSRNSGRLWPFQRMLGTLMHVSAPDQCTIPRYTCQAYFLQVADCSVWRAWPFTDFDFLHNRRFRTANREPGKPVIFSDVDWDRQFNYMLCLCHNLQFSRIVPYWSTFLSILAKADAIVLRRSSRNSEPSLFTPCPNLQCS